MPLSPILDSMPILILSPHSRCNCRCVMCDIWKVTEAREISPEELESHVGSIERLGVKWVVFTGGEPLMHSDLFRLSTILRMRGIRITLLSSGLLLERNAEKIVSAIDDLIVSLDGPPEIHNCIRRIPDAFRAIEAGVHAIRRLRPDFSISARCTVQRLNCRSLLATVAAARELGLNKISFLAADLTSAAFNRPPLWSFERGASVAITPEDLAALEREIDSLIAEGDCGGFIAETPAKLGRIVAHFRSHLGLTEPVAPLCNAPWVSAVVEADGTMRPCFFHPPVGKLGEGRSLLDIVNGPIAVGFRTTLDVASNPICRRCVCSLNLQTTAR
jgi:MoaA/NifB/PqqE/SkfB family radical SAM enzyme